MSVSSLFEVSGLRLIKRFLVISIPLFPMIASSNMDDGNMEIRQIAENVYLHTSYKDTESFGRVGSNGLVVISGSDAYIIDTPWPENDTRTLVEWIRQKGFVVKAGLSTHFHEDRTSGIAYLEEQSIKTYASRATNQRLKKMGHAYATEEFETTELPLPAGIIDVFYPGAGHTRDNIVVWLPGVKVLFGGCLVRSMTASTMGNTADASVPDWADSTQNVIDKYPQAITVVPGHGQTGGVELLSHTRSLAKTAASNKAEVK